MATSRWRRNCICWLIEAATDPSLLPHRSGGEIEITALSPDTPNLEGTSLDQMIREYANPNSGDYEIPAKIDKAVELAKESIRKGEKILLWCTFINSLHRLKQELDGFLTSNGNAPAIEIWGKVPRDSEVNDQWNREDEIEKFKSLTQDVDFGSEESFREKLDTLKESYFPKTQPSSTSEETFGDEDGSTAKDVDTTDAMKTYMSAISRNQKASA